jgi:hypothetical protein
MKEERHATIEQCLTHRAAVSVAEPDIEHGRRNVIATDQSQRLGCIGRSDDAGACSAQGSMQIKRDHGLVFDDQHTCAGEGSSLPVRISEVGRLHELELCDAWLRSDIATPRAFLAFRAEQRSDGGGALRQIHTTHELSRPRGCNRLQNQLDRA